MHALYIASVFLHIVAAIVWIGGMFFLILVVVPWLRRGNRAAAGTMLRDTGIRFRAVGWWCFGVLFATGTFNLWLRRVSVADLTSVEWLQTPFGRAVALKLALFAVVLAVSLVHDFVVGPRATRAMQADPGGAEALRLRRAASWLGRLNALFALGLVFLGVVLVRGWPW
jgi:copper resistance protein D